MSTSSSAGPADVSLTSISQLEGIVASAAKAAQPLGASPPAVRAALLVGAADALDARVEELVQIADGETALGATRLRGEVARTTGQLRLFAKVLLEGAYAEAIIDTADPAATPPRPDIRRILHPVGPVAVWAASNFPFAFSVAGGDTASALAAGCPVILVGHRGHPRTSQLTADVLAAALRDHGAPEGSFAIVWGREAGQALIQHPQIAAGAFTGSLAGGRALFDLASARPDPIPFYGELGSVNPVVVTRGAVRERARQIAEGLVASFTLGTGQFCTKPGVVFIPAGEGLEEHVGELVGASSGGRLLTPSIGEAFQEGQARLAGSGVAEVLAQGAASSELGTAPTVYVTDVGQLADHHELLLEECFGPSCVLIRYDGESDLAAAVDRLPGALTATIHGEAAETEALRPLLDKLQQRAGRVIWNGWPTGVAVTWSMHHGGPWPATTVSGHTSVGPTAIRRFLRPVAYQNYPQTLLPVPLRDGNPEGIMRRIDGRLTVESVPSPA